MSRTTSDLRALLERLAEEAPPSSVDDRAVTARLAGIRTRVLRRRRVQAAAAALALVVLAGSATIAGTRLGGNAAVEPAGPDSSGRPRVTTPQAEGAGAHDAAARLDAGWTDLHLVQRCAGSSGVTAVVLLDGREVARTTCGASAHDTVITARTAGALGFPSDQPLTVGLHLAKTRAGLVLDPFADLPAAHADLAVYSRGRLLPASPVPVTSGPGLFEPGTHVLLGSLTLPVTKDAGTRSFTIIPGGPRLHVYIGCTTAPGGPTYALAFAVNGFWTTEPCTYTKPDYADEASWTPHTEELFTGPNFHLVAGKPTTITFRAVEKEGPHPQLIPPLIRTIPGARMGIAVYGVPYLSGSSGTP